MKTVSKRLITYILSLVFTISLCGVLFASNSYSVTAEADDFMSVNLRPGASIKISDTLGAYGLRYAITMDKTDYDSLKEKVGDGKKYKNVSFGIVTAPANFIKLFGEINKDTMFGDNAIYYWEGQDGTNKHLVIKKSTSTLITYGRDESLVCFYSAMTEISSEYITSNFVSVGYVEYETENGVDYKFIYNDQTVRNMYQVALLALEDTDSTLTDKQRESIKTKYINNVNVSVSVDKDGKLFVPTNPGDRVHLNKNLAITKDSVIPDGYTLVIDKGCTLIIPEGVTLTNYGKIENNGTITKNGEIIDIE